MAIDLLLGKTTRDWSCGKSAAELWDEAESQRLHKPVRQMQGKSAAELWDEAESQRLHKPIHRMARRGQNELEGPPSSDTPWGWLLGIGAAATGLAILASKRS